MPEEQFQAEVMQQFQLIQQQFQLVQLQLGQLLQVSVTSHNVAVRLHNLNTHAAAEPLLPLRKERQPGAPGAAAYGALPPPGLFPVTHGQGLDVSEAACVV